MLLKNITLLNFRNIKKASFSLHKDLTVIIGKNAIGKTNLLEAIYYLLSGKGLREEKQEELIYWNENNALIKGVIVLNNDKINLMISLQKNLSVKKNYFINRIKKYYRSYLECCQPVVVFSPQLINIIDGNPDKRRRYINSIISLYDKYYYDNLTSYEKGLRKRNKILESQQDIFELQKQLAYWDEYLIKHGQYITEKRQIFTNYLNSNNLLKNIPFKATYIKNQISKESLNHSFRIQMLTKTTPVGPHRDDFEFFIITKEKEVELKRFGSRSQERITLFWLATCELKLFNQLLKKKPILLLDDIFSELDIENKSLIIDLIKDYQTILTTTETDILTSINIPYSIIKL